jgi:hypothetical protein
MEISLSRQLPIEVFEIPLEIARPQRRPDLHAILLRVKEKREGTTARDICDHLLKGRPDSVGATILRRCEDLGLLQVVDVSPSPDERWNGEGYETARPDDRSPSPTTHYALTPAGEMAIEQEEVFISEVGRFRLWVSSDPLLSSPLLDLQPRDEDEARFQNHEVESDQSALPELVRGLERQTLTLPGLHANRVRVGDVPRMGHRVAIHERATVIWSISNQGPSEVRLDGRFQGTLPAPRLRWEKIWEDILGPRSSDWVTGHTGHVLLTKFKDPELQPSELRTLRRTLRLHKPHVDGYGPFDPTEARDVPIAPATDDDALEWSEWLLEQMADQHIFAKDYEHLLGEVRDMFPGYKLRLPSQQALAEHIAERVQHSSEEESPPRYPPAFWRLRAPLDLMEKV